MDLGPLYSIKYFNELVSAKILSPIREGKEVFYVNDDLIRILEG